MMIGKISNLAENLLIIIVVGILCGTIGGYVGYSSAVNSHKLTVAQLKPTIDKAIDKETIKNEIRNEIAIGKIKKSDSLVIKLSPYNDQKPMNLVPPQQSGTNDCVDISTLSDSRKRRINRWLGK